MSKQTIPQVLCGVIPPHILKRVASQRDVEASDNARATLEHMRDLAGSAQTLIAPEAPSDDRQRVYDAGHRYELPGRLVLPREAPGCDDLQVTEAWDGSSATYDFFERVFGRRSIDGEGMRLDSTVHYGIRFQNAMWNGRQMVYGDGDGEVFARFTASVDVIAHELTHGVTQHTAALGYAGETGALNEHLSDAFGIMVKQYTLGQAADESDWLIGAELFGPAFSGCAVRSLALPGSAYHHPLLGTDPQPSHMRGYVHTDEDNGGVHINSGILNHAFYLAAMQIGGKTWEVLGRIWYAAMTEPPHTRGGFRRFHPRDRRHCRRALRPWRQDPAGHRRGLGGRGTGGARSVLPRIARSRRQASPPAGGERRRQETCAVTPVHLPINKRKEKNSNAIESESE